METQTNKTTKRNHESEQSKPLVIGADNANEQAFQIQYANSQNPVLKAMAAARREFLERNGAFLDDDEFEREFLRN